MGLCEDDPSCDNTYNAVMPLSRASTRGRYSRIVGVTSPHKVLTLSQCHLLNLDIMLLNILCIVIHQYVLHLSAIPCFLHWSVVLVLCCNAILFPNHTCVCCLSSFCMYSASIQFYIQLVLFLLCFPVVSIALTPYSLRPDYMLPKWIKKDVSRTEIRLDPSIFFPDGGNTCQYVMPFYSSVPIPSLCCCMFYN